MTIEERAKRAASEWYSMAPQYRTKARLAEHFADA